MFRVYLESSPRNVCFTPSRKKRDAKSAKRIKIFARVERKKIVSIAKREKKASLVNEFIFHLLTENEKSCL